MSGKLVQFGITHPPRCVFQMAQSPDSTSSDYENDLQRQNAALQSCIDKLTLQNKLMMERERLYEQQQQQQQQHPNNLLAPPFHHNSYRRDSNGQSSHSRSSSHSGHSRQMSKGHARRHSLAVSEARRAAHQRSNTPQNVNDYISSPASPVRPSAQLHSPSVQSPGPHIPQISQMTQQVSSFGGDPGPIASNNGMNSQTMPISGSMVGGPGPMLTVSSSSQTRGYTSTSYVPETTSEFRFPPSPVARKSHSRSQSVSSGFSPQRHRRTGSWRENSNTPNSNNANNSHLGHKARHSDVSEISRQQSGNRKLLFVPYFSHAQIPEMVSSGLLVTGVLRVDRKNRSHAYVSTPALDADVFIEGSRDRNRALDGDVVAVELLDVDDVWAQRKEKEERKRLRELDGSVQIDVSPSDNTHGSLVLRTNQKRQDDSEIEGQSLFLAEEITLKEDKPLYSGHVVAVLERPAGQLFSGTLGVLRPSSQAAKERQHARQLSTPNQNFNNLNINENRKSNDDKPKIVWFRPTDKHIPLMAIPTEQAPADLVDHPEHYANQIFIAQIKRWPITSLHPFGSIVERLGPCDSSLVTETALFRDANFDRSDLSSVAIHELEEAAQDMHARALELKSAEGEIVKLGKDLAASFRKNKSVVAIHVLDVSPSIPLGSTLDKELRGRSVGVYTEHILSPLISDEQSKTAIELRIGKLSPVITVELPLDGSSVKILNESIIPSTKSDESILEFLDAANVFRKHRSFNPLGDKNDEALEPFLDIQYLDLKSVKEVNMVQAIVKELEHATNAAVASELLKCPEVGLETLVRQQETPLPPKIENFAAYLSKHGIKIDTTNSATICKSVSKSQSDNTASAIAISLFKMLSPQKFTTASKVSMGRLGHYWFNCGVYTCFTRPLLRYADQIVARQVHTLLGDHPLQTLTNSEFSELTFRHDSALKLQKQALHLSLATSLSKSSPKICVGKVVNVQESSYDVIIPELCIEKRIHCDQLSIERCDYLESEDELCLKWLDNESHNDEINDVLKSVKHDLREGFVQVIKPFTDVVVQVHANCYGNIRPVISITAVNPFVG